MMPTSIRLVRSTSKPPPQRDLNAVAGELRRVAGGEVRFDAGSRALYATDASNYRQVPLGVVVPRDSGDVLATVEVVRRHELPLLGRGAGTSLAGQCCNAGIVLDFSKFMSRVIDIDAGSKTARVQPGVVLDDLRAAASVHGLTFGPDPATHKYCTLGGMIGNNSCGVRSVMAAQYGPGPTTADNVAALDVVTYEGTRMRLDAQAPLDHLARGDSPILRQVKDFRDRYAELIRREFPVIPRRVSGYNLPALLPENGASVARALVGSESTLALVLEATMRLIPARPHRVLVVLAFDDVFAAADRVPDVMRYGPIGLEGLDAKLAEDLRRSGLDAGNLRLLPDGGGWLLAEFGAESFDDALNQARRCAEAMRQGAGPRRVSVIESKEDQNRVWEIRESGLAATARVAGERTTWPGWEDSAVPPEQFGAYLRELHALFRKFEYDPALYGHFGQGCLHCRIDFDLQSSDGVARYRAFVEAAAELVHRYGGSLSGEHGDGQARGELLSRMFSPEMLQAFREFKSIWDPHWKMNPGKVIDARPLDADLRLGSTHEPASITTWFQFPEDQGSFTHATLRCVGVGKCRKTDSGTMCPSYMVTRDEQHTTRGRARLLFEMLQGDPVQQGWYSDEVHEALDLCLACKGCKGECPVHVDMATYKAEFLAHYFERHRRPRSAYAFGWVRTWAELASRAPRLVNLIALTPGLRSVAKAAAGMSGDRTIPLLAPQTFRRWFLARPPQPANGRRRVVLWPDTFNDHFHPETLRAAADVLERIGFRVEIPPAPLCCGRPLYDYGMLRAARRRLEEILEGLKTTLAEGTPIVVLEPSCLSVFRDELTNLLPDVDAAVRLRQQTFSFAEFLMDVSDRLPAASLDRQVLVQGHCHHKALSGMEAEEHLLDRLGVPCTVPDSGCCGMAGAFGFERSHYDISVAIGERALLPAVRRAARETLIVADGFSCREQIAQLTDRRAVHLAELMSMAMASGRQVPRELPERAFVRDYAGTTLRRFAIIAGAAVVGALVMAAMRARTNGYSGGSFATGIDERETCGGIDPSPQL